MEDIKIKKPTEDELEELQVSSWPIWECDPSTFDWEYVERETCYILEGEVRVEPEKGEPVQIKAGDLVVFPQGLKCVWKVAKKVRKHYKFGD